MLKNKTYSPKLADIKRQWHLIDANRIPLGRLSTEVSKLLTGKHKREFATHMDMGDHVIVINAAKIKLTGKKLDQKIYYRHSGFPGSLKSLTARQLMVKEPEKLIYNAVRGMLPKNKLMKARLARLYIYPNEEHKHEAQKPKVIEVNND